MTLSNSIRFYLVMSPFVAWLWSFPMQGPLMFALTINSDINQLKPFIIFSIFHGIGLLFYGFLARYQEKARTENSAGICLPYAYPVAGAVLCSLITVIIYYLPLFLQMIALALAGLAAAPFMIWCGSFLSMGVEPERRGLHLGITLVIAVALYLFFTLIPVFPFDFSLYYILAGILPLISVIYISRISQTHLHVSSAFNGKLAASRLYWPVFGILLLGFYTGGGLMYGLVYTRTLWAGNYTFFVASICYMLASLPVGYMADKSGRKYLIPFAFSCTGIGFILLAYSPSYGSQAISACLLQAGFASMDIFIWLTLADWSASNRLLVTYFSRGLSLNVMVIAFSSYCISKISHTSTYTSSSPLLVTIMLFLLMPLLSFLKETSPAHTFKPVQLHLPLDSDNPLQSTSARFLSFYDKYRLTPRERDVASFLLAGKDLNEIQEELVISPNTLKVHLRNIYRKTHCRGQKEFVLLAWKETAQIKNKPS